MTMPSGTDDGTAYGAVSDARDLLLSTVAEPADEIARSRASARNSDTWLRAFTVVNDSPFYFDPSRPLNGIAVGVKDLYDTAGLRTAYGSPIYRDHVPDSDAWLVGRLRQLGAHVAGKTVTTEFAWRQAGPTVNPHNRAHTPGGSSSGSAAAVAAGIVPLALGTQTFGSVIRPAAFCGVAGFKPGYGALSLQGVHPLSPSLDHAGYLARSLAGIRRVHRLVAGEDGEGDLRNVPGLRLRLVKGPYWNDASASQQAVLLSGVERLREFGADVAETELAPEFDLGLSLAEIILCREAVAIYRPLIVRSPDLVSHHIKELVRKGEGISKHDYRAASSRRDDLRQLFRKEMDGHDAIVTLPALGEAPPMSEGTGNPAPCVLWTLLGVPAANLPLSTGPRGLPLGLQLVGQSGTDFAFLDIATLIEAALDDRP